MTTHLLPWLLNPHTGKFSFANLCLAVFALAPQPMLGRISAEELGEPAAVVEIWPATPPGRVTTKQELDTSTPNSRKQAGKPVVRLGHVSKPIITVYKPPAANDTGAAVVVCPGGGYNILAYDLEGSEVCEWLNKIGVTGILLKYRVPKMGKEIPIEPLQDAQRAVSLTRSMANQWNIDPERVGILGFSAGGNLAARCSTGFANRTYKPVDAADQKSCRPDFTLLIYPAYMAKDDSSDLTGQVTVAKDTPPAFLTMAMDDPVDPENVLRYALACKRNNVSCEVHLYPTGGHGYGLRPTKVPASHWPDLASIWMKQQGLLKASAQ